MEQIPKIKLYREFDELLTLKLFGFESVEDYYIKSSSVHDLQNVKVQSMFINSRNDLLSPIDSVDINICICMFVNSS